jgi:hypothetical protein
MRVPKILITCAALATAASCDVNPTSLIGSSGGAPFYQSTVGAWEVRVWQTPADSSGWATATTRIVIPLQSGAKATVVITDNPGGGVGIQVI